MLKYNVFVYEVKSGVILATWDRVSRKRARWIVRQWLKKRITSTEVSVSFAVA